MNATLPTIIPDAETLVSTIVGKDDFVNIKGNVEIKRDLALKLFAVSKLSYTVEIQPPQVIGEREVVYIVKARVFLKDSRIAESVGAASTLEIEGERTHHDAIARAETRAFKRALELCAGLPFINSIIDKLFENQGNCNTSHKRNGNTSYNGDSSSQGNGKSITPGELLQKIKDAKSLSNLRNVWIKHSQALQRFSAKDRKTVTDLKDWKKQEFLTTFNKRR